MPILGQNGNFYYICPTKNQSKMHNLPQKFFTWGIQFLHMAVCPFFFMGFVLIYMPFGLGEKLDMGRGFFTLNLLICTCIILGVMAALRVALHFMERLGRFTWAHYVCWCLGEVFVCSLFVALYIALMLGDGTPYFSVLADALGILYGTLIFPYLILSLALNIGAHRTREREKNSRAADDDSLIRFVDEFKKLRLMIAHSAVLYIQAEENYVNIHYLDGDRVSNYVLRTSMRSLEETVSRHGIVRCQRSYYVNPAHVQVLRRAENGLHVADLDVPGQPGIPVSRKYYESLAKLL